MRWYRRIKDRPSFLMTLSGASAVDTDHLMRAPLTACHACDLLVGEPHPKPGSKALCPRCGTLIARPRGDTLNRSLALVLTGLLLYWPAVSLPALKMSVLTSANTTTVIQAFVRLWQGDIYAVAVLVLVCSILAPAARLLSLLVVLVPLKLKRCPPGTALVFRLHSQFDTWGMLEVYMIALLVSVIKLLDIADIHLGIGLFCLAGLMIVNLLLSRNLDRNGIWAHMEKAQAHTKC